MNLNTGILIQLPNLGKVSSGYPQLYTKEPLKGDSIVSRFNF